MYEACFIHHKSISGYIMDNCHRIKGCTRNKVKTDLTVRTVERCEIREAHNAKSGTVLMFEIVELPVNAIRSTCRVVK